MKQDQIFSYIRTILTTVGAFILGKNILGHVVDASTWQEAVACAMVVISIIWGLATKSETIEAIQSGLMQVVKFIGGFLVASGKISGETLVAIGGLLTALIPAVYSYFSRKKNQQISNGQINVNDLKGNK